MRAGSKQSGGGTTGVQSQSAAGKDKKFPKEEESDDSADKNAAQKATKRRELPKKVSATQSAADEMQTLLHVETPAPKPAPAKPAPQPAAKQGPTPAAGQVPANRTTESNGREKKGGGCSAIDCGRPKRDDTIGR
jgi:hypothetical protein